MLFWLHLALGVTAGVFIFIMSATGVMLAFERQISDSVDRDIRFVSVPDAPEPPPIRDLLEAVRRSGVGEPSAIAIRNVPQAAVQFAIGREKSVYVDPYSGAVLGASSRAARSFFSQVERWHRSLGAPLGSKGWGHWHIATSNLLFAVSIVPGLYLWLPRRWSSQALRAATLFRRGLRGRSRRWNWHNVLGIWCAVPLLLIAVTGVVMSYPWANTLLFRLSGSEPPARARLRGGDGVASEHRHEHSIGQEANYDRLLAIAKGLDGKWRTITLSLVRDANSPVQVTIDTGAGGQPQKRMQYLLQRHTGAILKTTAFADASIGQRLRSFVRFGHTGEWGGFVGQLIAAVVSLAACVLVYTGFSLSIRRGITFWRRRSIFPPRRTEVSLEAAVPEMEEP